MIPDWFVDLAQNLALFGLVVGNLIVRRWRSTMSARVSALEARR